MNKEILGANPNLIVSPQKALYDSVAQIQYRLEKTPIAIDLSGSTFISLLLIKNKLYVANVGDSRAIIAQKSHDFFSRWTAVPLSVDHKPDVQKETERIISKGGRVDPIKDFTGKKYGPSRVWLKNEDCPGLAMSRSIGDQLAKSVGVTWEPGF